MIFFGPPRRAPVRLLAAARPMLARLPSLLVDTDFSLLARMNPSARIVSEFGRAEQGEMLAGCEQRLSGHL